MCGTESGRVVKNIPRLAPLVAIADRLPDDTQCLGGKDMLEGQVAQLEYQILRKCQLDGISPFGVVLPTPLDVGPRDDDQAQGLLARGSPLGVNRGFALL